MLPSKKKPGSHDGFSILIGAGPPKKKPGDVTDPSEPDDDDFGGDSDDDEDDMVGEDDLAASGDDGDDADAVDPEQAHLAKQLGFAEPEQQKALIQLIQLVSGTGTPPDSSGGLGSLAGGSSAGSGTTPESGY